MHVGWCFENLNLMRIDTTPLRGLPVPLHRRLYKLWYHLVHRLLDEDWPGHDKAMRRGHTLCERWRRLSNFMEDVQTLLRFEDWKTGHGRDWKLITWTGEFGPNTCEFFNHKDIPKRVLRQRERLREQGFSICFREWSDIFQFWGYVQNIAWGCDYDDWMSGKLSMRGTRRDCQASDFYLAWNKKRSRLDGGFMIDGHVGRSLVALAQKLGYKHHTLAAFYQKNRRADDFVTGSAIQWQS